jgi:hypothetical protein
MRAGLEIDMPAGPALPPDGRWISEGIVKKAAEYGEEKAVRTGAGLSRDCRREIPSLARAS